ncbi:hypothetical protein [Baaleninema sp.]
MTVPPSNGRSPDCQKNLTISDLGKSHPRHHETRDASSMLLLDPKAE